MLDHDALSALAADTRKLDEAQLTPYARRRLVEALVANIERESERMSAPPCGVAPASPVPPPPRTEPKPPEPSTSGVASCRGFFCGPPRAVTPPPPPKDDPSPPPLRSATMNGARESRARSSDGAQTSSPAFAVALALAAPSLVEWLKQRKVDGNNRVTAIWLIRIVAPVAARTCETP